MPEVDWEKLGEVDNSVFDIHTGLKLDEVQMKAGQETEVKRMLEFEVSGREFGTMHSQKMVDLDWCALVCGMCLWHSSTLRSKRK